MAKTSYLYHPRKYELDVLHEIYFQLEWLFKNLNNRKRFKLYQSLVIQRQYYKVKDLLYKLIEYKESIELFEISKIWEDLSDEEIINRFNVIISSNPRVQSIIDFYLKKSEYLVIEDILKQDYYKNQLRVVNKNYKYDGKLHYFTMPTFKLFFYTGCIDLDVLKEHSINEKDKYMSSIYKNFYMARILNLEKLSQKQKDYIEMEKENVYEGIEKHLIHFPYSNHFTKTYFRKDLNVFIRWNPAAELPDRLVLDDLVIVEFVDQFNQNRQESMNVHCEYIQVVIPSIYYALPGQDHKLVSFVVNWFHQATSIRIILDKDGSDTLEVSDCFEELALKDLRATRYLTGTWLMWCQYVDKIGANEKLFYSYWWNIFNCVERRTIFHYNCDQYLSENHYIDVLDISYISQDASNVHECLYTLNNLNSLESDHFKLKLKQVSSNRLKVFAQTKTDNCHFIVSYEESKDPIELTLRFHLDQYYIDSGEYACNFFFNFDFNMIQFFDEKFTLTNSIETKVFYTYEHLRKYQVLNFVLSKDSSYVDLSFIIQLNTGEYNIAIEKISKAEELFFPSQRTRDRGIQSLTCGTYKFVAYNQNSIGRVKINYLGKHYGEYLVSKEQRTLNTFLNITEDGSEVSFEKESFLKISDVDILRYIHPKKASIDINDLYDMHSFLDSYFLQYSKFEESQFQLLRTFDKKIEGEAFEIDQLAPGYYKLVIYFNKDVTGSIQVHCDKSFIREFDFNETRVAVALIFIPVWISKNYFVLKGLNASDIEKIDIMNYKKEFVPVGLMENLTVDYSEIIKNSDDEFYNYYGKIENLQNKIVDQKIHLPFHNNGCFKVIIFFEKEQSPEICIDCAGKVFNLPGVNTGKLWIGFVIVTSKNQNNISLKIQSDTKVDIDHIDIRKMDYSKAFNVI